MILLSDEEIGEELNFLVDTDPLMLRDVAWAMYSRARKYEQTLETIKSEKWVLPNIKSMIDEALA